MKNYRLLFLIIILPLASAAQQADNWYFGIYAGLNFSNTTPVVLTNGKISTPEGCAAISDSSGMLLFYSDGITVWNNQHLPMPNGTGLLGGSSCTQAALIVLQPGSDSLYYVFTLDEIGGVFGFRYSMVDMSLENGLGDVTEKNVLIESSVTEKLTAVTSYDNSKVWVVIHDWGSDAFYTYQLTASGLNTIPIISYAGINHNTSIIQNTYGQMKFASCGGKLALAAGYLDTVEVFDFNLITGMVSNPVTIPVGDHVYGLEFSPDDTKLYVTCYDPLGTLLQYDLAAGNATEVINSKVILSNIEDLYALQLAPDGKIYVVKSYHPYLSVINDPNLSGTACNFVENAIYLDPLYTGVSAALGLPNFVQSYFDYAHKGCSVPTSTGSESREAALQLYPNPASGYVYLNAGVNEVLSLQLQFQDLAGRICMTTNINPAAESTLIDLSRLKSGIYYVEARNGKKVCLQQLLIYQQQK